MLRPFPKLFQRLCLLLAAAFAASCGQEAIKVYTVPKEAPPAVTERPPATPQLKWTTPAGWQEQPAGQLRVASFKITGQNSKQADVSVIPLSGAAGTDLSNVNRWRDQVGLAPVSEAEVKTITEPVEVSGQPAALYDLAGNPNGILAAIQRRAGTAWFFKMTGDRTLVAQQKPAFIAFLKSFQLAGEPDRRRPGGAPTDSDRRRDGGPQWTAPSDWKAVPGGQFLVAKFLLTGTDNATAAVNVSSSAGDGGGLVANVNRWRKQLGLADATDAELAQSSSQLMIAGGHAVVVSLRGDKTDLVGVVVLRPGQAWYYKLMGNPSVVAAQKAAFLKFVQEVKY